MTKFLGGTGEKQARNTILDAQALALDCSFSYSVVIPHGKVGVRLERCVESLVEQEIKPEAIIIVCNNGLGRDDVDLSAVRLSGIKLVIISPVPCLNANMARNRGAAVSTSRWIAFLDSDDAWAPSYATQVKREACSRPGVDIIYGSYIYNLPDGSSRTCLARDIHRYPNIYEYVMSDSSNSTCTLFVRRDRFLVVPWNETIRRHQDVEYFVRLHESGGTSSFVAEPLVMVDWTIPTRHKYHSDCLSVTGEWYKYVRPAIFVNYLLFMMKRSLFAGDWHGAIAVCRSACGMLAWKLLH